MIDDKKLIDKLRDWIRTDYFEDWSARNFILNDVIDEINKMPKVGEWIPVSERLPECRNNYMSKWERRPKKTRQDEFLEMFPNVELADSVIKICPKRLDGNYDRCGIYGGKISCIECHKDYWLQEVEE